LYLRHLSLILDWVTLLQEGIRPVDGTFRSTWMSGDNHVYILLNEKTRYQKRIAIDDNMKARKQAVVQLEDLQKEFPHFERKIQVLQWMNLADPINTRYSRPRFSINLFLYKLDQI